MLCVEHVRASAAGTTITLDHEKGTRIEGTAHSVTFPPGAVPQLEELLAKWEDVRGALPVGRCYFAFRHEQGSFPSSQIDAWLQLVISHLGSQLTPGEVVWP